MVRHHGAAFLETQFDHLIASCHAYNFAKATSTCSTPPSVFIPAPIPSLETQTQELSPPVTLKRIFKLFALSGQLDLLCDQWATTIKRHGNILVRHYLGIGDSVMGEHQFIPTSTHHLGASIALLLQASDPDRPSFSFVPLQLPPSKLTSPRQLLRHLIGEILLMKNSLSYLLTEACEEDERFATALRTSVECFINGTNEVANGVAMLLAKHCDSLMQAGWRDTEIERGLMHEAQVWVIDAFRALSSKDHFEAFYKKDLGRRLLLGKSSSDEGETSMIKKLKSECGASFVAAMEGMFKELERSKEIFAQFQLAHEAQRDVKALGIQFEVHVLGEVYWPAAGLNPPTGDKGAKGQTAVEGDAAGGKQSWDATGGVTLLKNVGATGQSSSDRVGEVTQAALIPQVPYGGIKLPSSPCKLQDLFEAFYLKHHKGRKLRWLVPLGGCTIRALFGFRRGDGLAIGGRDEHGIAGASDSKEAFTPQGRASKSGTPTVIIATDDDSSPTVRNPSDHPPSLNMSDGDSIRSNQGDTTVMRHDERSGKISRYDLVMSQLQAVSLLLFNTHKELSMKHIHDATGIEMEELSRQLMALSFNPKSRVLVKQPAGVKEWAPSDVYTVNDDFNARTSHVVINQVQLKETRAEAEETSNRVESDRSQHVDASIVRVLKGRGKMTHSLIVSEVVQHLNKFNPTHELIKSRISNLIERDFIARDPGDTDVYHYVS
eukprot:GHVN01073914.1.p1 GENE.GHVN01073914.1~~GHVN01073914.1.p1  ORF type:complete len:734 (-),score=111.60 GHVN01073914.1:562-2715(-)